MPLFLSCNNQRLGLEKRETEHVVYAYANIPQVINLNTNLFFVMQEGYFENAVECCKNELYFPEVDGSYIGAWLATE